jgi:hypothetical protein
VSLALFPDALQGPFSECQVCGMIEGDEWKLARGRTGEQARYAWYAKATFRKDR